MRTLTCLGLHTHTNAHAPTHPLSVCACLPLWSDRSPRWLQSCRSLARCLRAGQPRPPSHCRCRCRSGDSNAIHVHQGRTSDASTPCSSRRACTPSRPCPAAVAARVQCTFHPDKACECACECTRVRWLSLSFSLSLCVCDTDQVQVRVGAAAAAFDGGKPFTHLLMAGLQAPMPIGVSKGGRLAS
jgi:hypothetical protein